MAAPKGNQYAKGCTTSGAPKVEPEFYNPNWKKEIIDAYKDGKSDIWIRVNCFNAHRVSDDLWYRWIKDIEEFAMSVKEGKLLSQAWWEDVSQEHADGSRTSSNAVSLIFNMTNRFKKDWKQRQTVEQTNKHSLDIDSIDEIRALLEESGVDVDKL